MKAKRVALAVAETLGRTLAVALVSLLFLWLGAPGWAALGLGILTTGVAAIDGNVRRLVR